MQGRAGTDHLFLVDGHGERYIAAADTPLTFMRDYLADLHNRTEHAITQAHVFTVSALALHAQAQAQMLAPLATQP